MNGENKKLLEDEIQAELEALNEMELGSEEYKMTVDILLKLIDRSINIKKIELEARDKNRNRETEKETKLRQMELDRDIKEKQLELDRDIKEKQLELDRDIKEKQLTINKKQLAIDSKMRLVQTESETKNKSINNWIMIAGIVIPAFLTVWGTYKSFEFEKEGTVTTIMGRGFVNKLLPKK